MATTMLRRRNGVRRGLAIISAAAAIAALTGCSSGGGNSSSGDSKNPSGNLQILVSSADGSDAGFRAIDAAFEKAYPKVKVVFDTVPNGNYPASESSRLTAGNVDIVTVQSRLYAPSYAKGSASNDVRLAQSGQFVDLTAQPFMKNFSSSVLAAQEFKGKDYTIPTGVSYETGVYYNKATFQKYGLSVPTTWSEFVQLSDTLKSKGVTPLGIGGKDSWPAGLPMLAAVQGAYPTESARSALAEDLWKQKVKLTDPSQVAILEKVQKVYSYAQKGFAGVPYSSIPGDFANGDFAMTPDGTWDQTTIAQAVGSKFDVGYFPLPTSDNAADNKFLGGKVELRLAVASNAKNKTAALAWMKFFSEAENYPLFLDKAGFAPSVNGVKGGAFLDSISGYTSTFQPAWDQIWVANNDAGNGALFPYNYPAVTPMGSNSAAQAATAAQKAWAAAF